MCQEKQKTKGNKGTFYITTPIYYPSGKLHIGHTYTTVASDVMSRFKREMGYDVKFLTGTDEHGEKIQTTAKAYGMEPKAYVDQMVADIKKIWESMEISYDIFIRTTDEIHKKGVQAIFQQLYDKGDIYKDEYEGWYCTPCESFWTETQLEEGHKCPDCHREAHLTREEAYFFRLSKYQDPLIQYYEDHPEICLPESRKREMLNNFLKPGLEDLCVSRTSFDWGIPVPFDEKHVIYVWLDALSNYITALGYGSQENPELYNQYWPADVHLMAKEIVRFHTIIWPAMLMALELPLPKKVFGHGWILFGEDKMSKSKGNIVYPEPFIQRYGIDALKYFLLREFTFGQDGNFTNTLFLQRYNSDLANDLGNLVSRTVAMIEQYNEGILPAAKAKEPVDDELKNLAISTADQVEALIDELQFHEALEQIWKIVRRSNKYIDETTPWILSKDESQKDRLDTVLNYLAESIRIVSILIKSFMGHTSAEIQKQLGLQDASTSLTWEDAKTFDKIPADTKVKKGEALFKRLKLEQEAKELAAANEAYARKILKVTDAKKEDKKEDNKETAASEPKEEITIDDFAKIDLKVAVVKEAEKHPKADRLLVLQLQVGDEIRQVVSGIAQDYTPEELVGKTVIYLQNLKPIKLRGVKSQGMIMAAEGDGKLGLLTVDKDLPDGSSVS
ncbi:MAG: methionine--tRNA ligase [Tindallia sp. MSAO_Bac2]|nr:MAG: methionine--tRNA ligase [Tindallia sp. MSAO_Bac2]